MKKAVATIVSPFCGKSVLIGQLLTEVLISFWKAHSDMSHIIWRKYSIHCTETYGDFVEAYSKSYNQGKQVHFVNSPCMFYSIGIKHWNSSKHNDCCKSCCWDIFECWSEKLSGNYNTHTSDYTTSWSLNSWLSIDSSTRKTSSDRITKTRVLESPRNFADWHHKALWNKRP